jgi:hypothetical protein
LRKLSHFYLNFLFPGVATTDKFHWPALVFTYLITEAKCSIHEAQSVKNNSEVHLIMTLVLQFPVRQSWLYKYMEEEEHPL